MKNIILSLLLLIGLSSCSSKASNPDMVCPCRVTGVEGPISITRAHLITRSEFLSSQDTLLETGYTAQIVDVANRNFTIATPQEVSLGDYLYFDIRQEIKTDSITKPPKK